MNSENWIKHINNDRSFYRKPGDDNSMVLELLGVSSENISEKKEYGIDEMWFEERWNFLNKLRVLYWNVDSFTNMNYIDRLNYIKRNQNWDILILVEAGKKWSHQLLNNLSYKFDGIHWNKPYLVSGTEQGILIIWRKQLLSLIPQILLYEILMEKIILLAW